MPASGVITSGSGLYSNAALATLTVNGHDLGPMSFVSRVRKQTGLAPSYALCYVPLAALYDTAPSVAGVTSSPIYGIKEGDVAIITGQLNPQLGAGDAGTTLIVGSVTGIDPDIGDDEALITVEDDRWILEGKAIIGSWWVDKDGNPQYREGVKAHFNKSNHPNAIWCKSLGVPLFCPDFFGINDTLQTTGGSTFIIPGESDASTTQATYWTPRMKWAYGQFISSTAAAVLVEAQSSKFPWYRASCTIDDPAIVWPTGLESVFDIVNATGQTSNYDRKCVEKIYHCYKLLDYMHDICREAGAFDINMEPIAAGQNPATDLAGNTISIAHDRYEGADLSQTPSATSNQGMTLPRSVKGKASSDYQYGDITGGKLRESAKSLFVRVIVVGGHAFIETRLTNSTTDETGGTGGLAWGFTTTDVDKTNGKAAKYLLQYMNGAGTPTLQTAMKSMFDNYESILCCYRINPATAFAAGTTQANFPEAKLFRPPLPHLLSSYLQNGAGDYFAQINSRRPIPVEYTTDDAGTVWAVMPQPDGIEIYADGTISFQSLRDSLLANVSGTTSKTVLWDIALSGSYPNYTLSKFQPMGLRMTLAIPCDHRLTAVCGTSSTLVSTMPLPGGVDDSERINGQLVRTLAIDTGALHTLEERGGTLGSYPIPQSLKQADGSNPPAAGDGSAASKALFGDATVLRDDTQLAINHAIRGLAQTARLDRGGTLVSDDIDLMAVPGMAIAALSNRGGGEFPIKAMIHAVEHDFEPPQRTTRHLR